MGFLIYDRNEQVDIGVPVVTYRESSATSFYHVRDRRQRFSRFEFETLQGDRKKLVNKIVLHHDGMRTARGCFRVLVERGLSTHIMIDEDGTVYQPLGLKDIGWHATPMNKSSIGIDLNNPIHPSRCANPQLRQTYRGVINNGVTASLGYTDAQYEALAAVLEGLFQIFKNIKRQAPVGDDGQVIRRKLINTEFSGVVGHYHISASKWDPGPGFDWERVLIGIRGKRLFFPVTLPETTNLAHAPKRQALTFAKPYFENTEQGRSGGYFPVGINQAWHTGVHLNVRPDLESLPVVAPADGEIVVARNTEPEKMGSPNVVVIRHELPVGDKDQVFYSVLTHLRQEELGRGSPIPWIARFARQGGPTGLPEDDDLDYARAAPGHIALLNGRAALGNVPVKAGELIGHTGAFSGDIDGGELMPLLDFAMIAKKPLFPADDTTFEIVDGDVETDILCNARAVWKRYTTEPQKLRGLTEGGYPLAPAEIRAFFAGDPEGGGAPGRGADESGRRRSHEDLRWLAVRHVTEWSDETNFAGLFGGGLDFEWSTRKAAQRYVARVRPFLWWDKRVTDHTGLPKDRLIYAYHPIALLAVLAAGEAKRVFEPGEEGYEAGLDDRALARAVREDAQFDSHHNLNTERARFQMDDIVGGTDIDGDEALDPEREGWMRWEQGEWEPEWHQ